MGRFLSAGIATTILISGPNVFQQKEKILNQMKKFLDIQNYEVHDQEKNFYLRLKTDVFEQNIYEFVGEFYKVRDFYNTFLEEIENNDIQEFTKEKYPLKLLEDEKDDLSVQISNVEYEIRETDFTWENFSYIFLDDSFQPREVRISLKFIPIWMEPDKTLSEDPTNMLYFLNLFSRNYFQSPLGKHFLFYIEG